MKMDSIQPFLKLEFLNNSVRDYLIAVGIFLVVLVAFKIFKNIVLKNVKKWAKKTETDIDDEIIRMIGNIPGVAYGYISLYVALRSLAIHATVMKVATTLLIILVFFWATKAASDLLEFLLYKFSDKKDKKREDKSTTFFAFNIIVKVILWSTGLLLVLSNLGVNISALVASLGIGGIAVALALQNILSDMFSSFSIYLDKPFEIGDYIVVGDQSGTVKRIGIKTTRVEALQGEEIVFSNRELTTAQVRNFKKMKKRRIAFDFGVTYDTPTAKLKKIPKILKEIFKKTKLVDLDRAHFHEFGDFSLNYEVVYFIKSGSYAEYMGAQQTINLAIMDAFAKEGIEMAFPTQTIYVQK